MTSQTYDAIIIGGGQAGLAAGYHLQNTGLRFVILEANEQVGGSWPHTYESLQLFSPAGYSNLPGLPFPGDPNRYPTRDEVTAYLRQYAAHFALPVMTNSRVTAVTKTNNRFLVQTENQTLQAKALIAASGPFNKPHIPDLPGMDQFTGTILHAFDYQRPSQFADQRVVIVGGGNSAVQIAAELGQVADVTLATREPIWWTKQRVLGKDVHFWYKVTGFDASRLAVGDGRPPVLDSGNYQAALKADVFEHRPMFDQFTEEGVVWADGTTESVDTVILGTGYRPNLGFLDGLDVLDEAGNVRHKKGISLNVPGLYFNGLALQRNHASATLRGSGPDAEVVVKHLQAYLQAQKASAQPEKRNLTARLQVIYCQLFC